MKDVFISENGSKIGLFSRFWLQATQHQSLPIKRIWNDSMFPWADFSFRVL